MNWKQAVLEPLTQFLTVVIYGLGLTIEPGVFIGCLILSSAGAYLGPWFSPQMKQRRPFLINLFAGAIVMLGCLLILQNWWPGSGIAPQLIAIGSGFFGPLLLPVLQKNFPAFADRWIAQRLATEKEKPK